MTKEELKWATILALTTPPTGNPIPPAPPQKPYLTFHSAVDDFTIETYNHHKNWDGILEYSTDLTTWTVWDGTGGIGSVGKFLYIRGTGNSVISGESKNWVLTGSRIECDGNIEALLDYIAVLDGAHPVMADGCFAHLFYGNADLIRAPELRTRPLSDSCYSSMFRDCTSLETAPILPAWTLTDSCYANMFAGCTALSTPPSLRALSLAPNCYLSMFSDSGLQTAPELPAMSLAQNCYANMFSGCDRLYVAPSLPATTLAINCYSSMFSRCSWLNTIPKLVATGNLPRGCYSDMFSGCTQLYVQKTGGQHGDYMYRIPYEGSVTPEYEDVFYLSGMFFRTRGDFEMTDGTPEFNTTYYVENEPV